MSVKTLDAKAEVLNRSAALAMSCGAGDCHSGALARLASGPS